MKRKKAPCAVFSCPNGASFCDYHAPRTCSRQHVDDNDARDAAAVAATRGEQFRSMVVELLASAHPHPIEPPTMHAAWTKARRLLADNEEPDAGGKMT